jgi:hypothetical protein
MDDKNGISATTSANSAGPNAGAVQQQQQQHKKQQQQLVTDTTSASSKLHINTSEKLKRGLTSFMSHLNPGVYFVPHDAAKASSVGSQATIINEGGSDAVIKGPNRLTRPLGSPLRWG